MENRLQNFFINLLITPLFLLKWIGDLIISVSRIFLQLELQTYKFFSKNAEVIPNWFTLSLPNVFRNLMWMLKRVQHDRLRRRKKIVYRKKIKWTAIFRQKLKRMKFLMKFHYKRIKIPRLPIAIRILLIKIQFFVLGAIVVGLGVFIFQLYTTLATLPNPTTLDNRDIPTTSKIFDRHGKLLYEIYADKNRIPIKLAEVPLSVKNATVAIEDQEFYLHQGFSLRGIIRAVYHNLTSDSLEGGSTITQQLVRNAFLTPEKTWERKIKEIILSVWAEQLYSKDQILEMYLNQVPYGGTAWGIEAASETYFGKNVHDLSLSESALLAGLPAAPSRFSPFGDNPKLAKTRQLEVLQRMSENGYISPMEEEKAATEPLNYKTPRVAILAPHFVMYVKSLLEQYYGTRLVEQGGLRITTTLDLGLQEMAQRTVSKNLELLRSLSVGNGAALITNPKTGEILSMVGSRDYFDIENQGNVNVTRSLRQPGSSIKVVTYATALSTGFTAASILDDSPITYRITEQLPYSPINYDGKYHGQVSLRTALASSYNIPAVKTLSAIGIRRMIEQGKLMGITSWQDENRFGLSLTLGGGEVTMLDMAKVYGTLADSGLRMDLTSILNVTDYKGSILPLPPQKSPLQAVGSGVAFILSSILSDNQARTPAFGPSSALNIPGKTVAVKTGTSDNKRDNWTIGYTPDYLVEVWVGNNDNAPMHPTLTSGVTGAAPIWQEIMTDLLKDKTDKPFLPPQDILTLPCNGRVEYFIAGTEPKGGCPRPLPSSPTPTPVLN